jgi:hypothetical protein
MQEEEEEALPAHPQLQMRLSVMAGLNARLSEVTTAWQQMRADWHEEDQAEVARQLHTVTGRDFPPEEVENMVQNGGSETIYRQALSNVSGATVSHPGGGGVPRVPCPTYFALDNVSVCNPQKVFFCMADIFFALGIKSNSYMKSETTSVLEEMV